MPLDKVARKRRNANSDRTRIEKPGISDAADANAADSTQLSNPMERACRLVASGRVTSPQEAAAWSGSSGDFADLCRELDRRDAEERRRLREAQSRGGGKRSNPDRDVRIALEFRRRHHGTNRDLKPTDLKEVIGRRPSYGLRRTAAIDACNRGEKIIDALLTVKAEGRDSAEIAKKLNISLETVELACAALSKLRRR
jgi:hypothetical protein